jgi:hypothetical protein
VAVEDTVPTDPGKAVFFNANGQLLSVVTVGVLPDMITFTPNGQKVLVANEAQPSQDYKIDPEGSVSIIDMRRGAPNITQGDVITADFRARNDVPLDPRIRIFGPNATVAPGLGARVHRGFPRFENGLGNAAREQRDWQTGYRTRHIHQTFRLGF